MWYTLSHADTFICTHAHGGRAGKPRDQAPVRVRPDGTPLPDPPCQCRRPVDDYHCPRTCAAPMPTDLRCTDQTVRNAMHAFHQRGLAVLQPLSSRPHTIATIFDVGPARPCGRCGIRVHGPSTSPPAGGPFSSLPRSVAPRASPRAWSATQPCGWPSGGWACRGNTPNTGSPALIRPMPEKKRRDRLIPRANTQPTWALGFGDAVWWSSTLFPYTTLFRSRKSVV